MAMPTQGEVEVVGHSILGSFLGQDSAQEEAAKRGGDFHVTQGRDV